MFGIDDVLTYGPSALQGGSKLAGGLMGLFSGNAAALPSSLISMIPTAMSTAGSAMGGSASAGLSALASGVAPTLASALSVYAGPAAVAAYIASTAIQRKMNANKVQGAKQAKEYGNAMQALPSLLKARAGGAGQLTGLASLNDSQSLLGALSATHGGIQSDLGSISLQKALDMAVNGPDSVARHQYGVTGGDPAWAPVRDQATGSMATDNYMAQLLLTDAAGRQGLDTSAATKWGSYGGDGGGQAVRDNNGTLTGWQDAEGKLGDAPKLMGDWTWDDDFLNNAVSTLGQAYGIDASRLPGAAVYEEGGGTQRDAAGNVMGAPSHALKLTAADIPGWEAGHYADAITSYLKGLDPNIEQSDAYKRYQGLAGLSSLMGQG